MATTSTPLARAAEALRCRFTDLAGLYAQPGGSQHRIDSLWWWVKFVYDHSALRSAEGGGSLRRVFALSEGHKSIRAAWGKSKAYLFALAYKYTAHWRACAEREPQPQQQEGSTEVQAAPVLVKPDPEDQLLAWLDLLLLIAWKHMSTQTAKSRKGWLAFPFVTLKRAAVDESDPATAVFSDYEYLGLTTVEEASCWQLEWADEGEKAFQHWSGREDEIKALGSLRRRLIDDRAEAALADARKALSTAIGGRARQSKATVIDLTAETVVKLSAEVGALREELSKLLAETKKQKKKRLRVKKEKKEKKKKEEKKNKKRKKEKEEGTEDEESDDDRSDDDANGDDHVDDDEDDEIEDEGDDQSQTTLSRKRKRQEEQKKKINGKKKKKKKKSNNKKEKKRRTDDDEGEAEKKEEEKRAAPEEQDDDIDEDGDDGEERHKLVRRRKRRARSLFEMRAGSCTQS